MHATFVVPLIVFPMSIVSVDVSYLGPIGDDDFLVLLESGELFRFSADGEHRRLRDGVARCQSSPYDRRTVLLMFKPDTATCRTRFALFDVTDGSATKDVWFPGSRWKDPFFVTRSSFGAFLSIGDCAVGDPTVTTAPVPMVLEDTPDASFVLRLWKPPLFTDFSGPYTAPHLWNDGRFWLIHGLTWTDDHGVEEQLRKSATFGTWTGGGVIIGVDDHVIATIAGLTTNTLSAYRWDIQGPPATRSLVVIIPEIIPDNDQGLVSSRVLTVNPENGSVSEWDWWRGRHEQGMIQAVDIDSSGGLVLIYEPRGNSYVLRLVDHERTIELTSDFRPGAPGFPHCALSHSLAAWLEDETLVIRDLVSSKESHTRLGQLVSHSPNGD